MMVLLNPAQIPSGGWYMTHPETGQSFAHAQNVTMVWYLYRKYCAENNLPVPDVNTLTQIMCSQRPELCQQDNRIIIPYQAAPGQPRLTEGEMESVFGKSDAKLIGDRIEAVTKAIGLPTCSGCQARKEWLNKAHQWVKDHL